MTENRKLGKIVIAKHIGSCYNSPFQRQYERINVNSSVFSQRSMLDVKRMSLYGQKSRSATRWPVEVKPST